MPKTKKRDVYQHKGTMKQINLLLIAPLDRPDGESGQKICIYYYLSQPGVIRTMTQSAFNEIFNRPYTNNQLNIE